MKIFKISMKEFIFLILISAPIGAFLYLNNYNKIKYKLIARQGYVIAENFCENNTPIKLTLMDSDIYFIAEKYKGRSQHLESSLDLKNNIILRKDIQAFEIMLEGRSDQEGKLAQRANEILNDISHAEILSFNNNFKNVKIHCHSGEYKVFKFYPIEKINNEFPLTRKYKNSYLYFLSILPIIILYLLIISFKYTKNLFFKIRTT